MNRLTTELKRLYLPHEQAAPLRAVEQENPTLLGSDGRVRAIVFELQRPAGWNAAATLWQGVQEDLGLPAPAIAVSGQDGYQLWFSLMQAVTVAQAHEFLDLLRVRFLGAVEARHVRLLPVIESELAGQACHASLVPARQVTGRWSAFVSPDLAMLFADEPWLDLEPGTDAQADLLCRLASIGPEDFRRVLERLAPASDRTERLPAAERPWEDSRETSISRQPGVQLDPRQFLLEVMNDPKLEMKLRIKAARALLPDFESQRNG